MQLECMGSCEAAGTVQVHNTGGVHWRSPRKLKVFKDFKRPVLVWISVLLRPFIMIYREFLFFILTDVYRPLI